MGQSIVGGVRDYCSHPLAASARVEVWADGQTGPRQDNMVILKNGRMFDVTGTTEAQSRWSAYAAIAEAAAATLQALSLFLKD
jgi:hypothetical protein